MQKQFTDFADNIRLTPNQEEDARIKYDGVCSKLHSSYYPSAYNGSTKFLFGSYKTKTNVRPITENQDVDVLFKIPEETYKKYKGYKANGPSALLQEVKDFLKEKYTTTDEIKAWGKVVLIRFADNTHNVEVLPAYEETDGTFTIPNTKDNGSWDKFDPRTQIDAFQASNTKTNGLTADLTRMLKTWVDNTATCSYPSFLLLENVMSFLTWNYSTGANYSDYSQIILDYFEFLKNICDKNLESHVKTAKDRVKKANDYEKEEKPKEASEEWRKIFGSEFPLVEKNPVKENQTRVFTNPSAPYGCL